MSNSIIQLNKDKTRNIIIAVIVLILVVGGIFYYKISQKNTTEVSGEKQEAGTINENKSILEENTNIPNNTPQIISVDNTKFDTLLQNGSKAFMDKNYSLAIKIYNEALSLDDSHVVYIRLYSVYNAQGEIKKAEDMLNKAIVKNPSYTDYWTTKLLFLDEKTNMSFVDLKMVYEDGMKKVDSRTKVNLVTVFARIAENKNEKQEAITLWQKAIELHPENKDIYQAEIDRLK